MTLEPLSSLPANERCDYCGEPDNCGDCDHTPLPDEQLASLGLYREDDEEPYGMDEGYYLSGSGELSNDDSYIDYLNRN